MRHRPDTPPRRPTRPRSDEGGAALILTLLVLAILVVLTVQLAYSVKVEANIVSNGADDAALELAARGAVPLVAAILREERSSGAPPGDVDTLADALFDPRVEEARTLKVGEATITVEAEDLDRRLPLAWLADETRREFTEVALRRLIDRLGLDGVDAEAAAKAISEQVQALNEEAAGGDPTAAPPPAPVPGQGQEAKPPLNRRLISLEQLLAPDAGAQPGDPSAPAPPPDPGATPATGGVERRLLYGEPDADPPKPGLAPFVTTWPLNTINLNTASGEVLFGLLPEQDKAKEPTNLWEIADELVEAIRNRRVDPALAEGDPAGGEGPVGGAPAGGGSQEGGGQGASRSWPGQPFGEVDQLQSAEIHAKLAQLFTRAEGEGEGTGGAGAGGAAGQDEEEGFQLRQALAVRSEFYALRVRVRLREDVEGTYRLIVHRNDQDEVRCLLLEEVAR